jgi:hypothetical protein
MYEEEKLNRTGVEPVTVKFAIYYTTVVLPGPLKKSLVTLYYFRDHKNSQDYSDKDGLCIISLPRKSKVKEKFSRSRGTLLKKNR